jgi:hypothetical protein
LRSAFILPPQKHPSHVMIILIKESVCNSAAAATAEPVRHCNGETSPLAYSRLPEEESCNRRGAGPSRSQRYIRAAGTVLVLGGKLGPYMQLREFYFWHDDGGTTHSPKLHPCPAKNAQLTDSLSPI